MSVRSCFIGLIQQLGKINKMRGLQSVLYRFCNEFDKFNKTWARMLDSIDHMTLSIL